MTNTNESGDGGNSGNAPGQDTEAMLRTAAELAKIPDGNCEEHGHKWQLSNPHDGPMRRFCLRCYAKQAATSENGPILTTHGCARDAIGHSWVRTSKADRRCLSCGEERSFIDAPSDPRWVVWYATGGVVRTPNCPTDGHDWQLGIGTPDIVRHCRRCGDRQEAIPDTPTPGCTRVEGHVWLPANVDGGHDDGGGEQCSACGLERFLDDAQDWAIWVAVGGKATIYPVKASPVLPDSDPDHERVRRPDPPGKKPTTSPFPPDKRRPDPFLRHQPVTKPSHYQGLDGTDVLDMLANFEMTDNHYRCCAIEYALRAGKKGTDTDALRDLKKAVEYLSREIEDMTEEPFTRAGRAT